MQARQACPKAFLAPFPPSLEVQPDRPPEATVKPGLRSASPASAVAVAAGILPARAELVVQPEHAAAVAAAAAPARQQEARARLEASATHLSRCFNP